MNVQAAPSPYSPVGATHTAPGNPPVLGAQAPGTTGGLPALGGLSVGQNPLDPQLRSQVQGGPARAQLPPVQNTQSQQSEPQQAAQQVQQYGRGEDTMLVHMTPGEVNSLRGLAQRFGGDLTTNPSTGLPEAGFLSKILPILAGVGLNFILPGSGGIVAALGGKAATAGLMTAAAGTAITGDLQKGLMAGLGAFGGASLAGGIQGALGSGAKSAAGAAAPAGTGQGVLTGAVPVEQMGSVMTPTGPMQLSAFPGAAAAAKSPVLTAAASTAPATGGGLMHQFGNAARGTMTGVLGKAAPMAAGLGLLSGVSNAMTPGFRTMSGATDNSYQGPYRAQERPATFAPSTQDILSSSKERDYFAVDQPEIYNMQGQVVQPGSHTAPGTPIVRSIPLPLTKKQKRRGAPMYAFETVPWMGGQEEEPGFAKGGEVQLAEGAFVVDARTVSEIGNGSSNAGIEALARMGGRPVRGPGDGVSDSVPARIGRDQPARVARDEVIFSPQAVQRVGGGDVQRGAKKLYALMDKAHSARRKSARGKDTGLRKGLA